MNAAPAIHDPDTVTAQQPRGLRFRAFWLLERGLALGVAMLLLRSSFAHLGNPYYFLSSVYSYQIVGIETGRWFAVLFPFVQLTTAILLLTRWWAFEGYVAATVMFIGFIAVQLSAMARDLDIACGCFGSSSTKVGLESLAVAFAGTFAALLGGGAWWQVRTRAKTT